MLPLCFRIWSLPRQGDQHPYIKCLTLHRAVQNTRSTYSRPSSTHHWFTVTTLAYRHTSGLPSYFWLNVTPLAHHRTSVALSLLISTMFAPRSHHIATLHADFRSQSIDTVITTLEAFERDPLPGDQVYKMTVTDLNNDDAIRLLDWLGQPTRKLPLHTPEGGPPITKSTLPLRYLILCQHSLDRHGYKAVTRFLRDHSSLTSLALNLKISAVSVFGSGITLCSASTDAPFQLVYRSGTLDDSHVTTLRYFTFKAPSNQPLAELFDTRGFLLFHRSPSVIKLERIAPRSGSSSHHDHL